MKITARQVDTLGELVEKHAGEDMRLEPGSAGALMVEVRPDGEYLIESNGNLYVPDNENAAWKQVGS